MRGIIGVGLRAGEGTEEKGCVRLCGRLDQNAGFHGNRQHRQPPLTYNGESQVSDDMYFQSIRTFEKQTKKHLQTRDVFVVAMYA